MSYFPPEIVQDIVRRANIEEVISHFYTLNRSGRSLSIPCPKCGMEGKGKGLMITPSKGIYKCFSCQFGGKSPVDFLMETQAMDYPAALKFLADKYNIIIPQEAKAKGPQKKGGKKELTFRDRQLAASGLTDSDQKATVFVDEKTQKIVDVFEAGTRDQYGKISPGDDLIIWYYDLEGKPVMYQKPKSTRMEQLFRIRWQNPDLHNDSHGRPMKYSSPYGSGSHLFIPEEIRNIYKERRIIKRLYCQEGEKKALKACKHGIPSVGMMGIQNLGQDGKLPYELQLIVQTCKVEEVIFILDSDWDHLSNDLKPGQRVDQRASSFFYAVKNFRKYFKTFTNLGIYLEIYFATINENDAKEKGIDDLLAGSLAGKENDLYDDINFAINEKNGKGKLITLNQISVVTDLKLREFWNLHSAESFATKYRDQLEQLPEFIIGHNKWRFNEKGKFESAQPLEEDEFFYERLKKTNASGEESSFFKFNYLDAFTFLSRRGYGRIRMANNSFLFAHINNKVVEICDPHQIGDYILEFAKETSEKSDRKELMNMLYRGAPQYFGPNNLGRLSFVEPVFESSGKSFQYLYFKDKYWKISAEGIEENPLYNLQNYVWKDKIIDFDAKLLNHEMITVERIDDDFFSRYPDTNEAYRDFYGQFNIDQSKDSLECHFSNFLINTGEFFWRKFLHPLTRSRFNPETNELIKDERALDERLETNLHLVSKMTAIGYLLHKYRDKSCEKAVIAMDGRISEVGESNGRTGKSIYGFSIGKVIPQAYIGAKAKDLTEDPFLLEEVNEKIDNVFLDDVRANVDFEHFFPWITGKMTINQKGQKKFTLSENDTPKILVTTNHAINGNSSSFKDRQALIAFSDFYSDTHKPIDDFGINFFDEWDERQWNLFYNFMANCLQLYFKAQKLGWGINRSGLIEPPTERLELRRIRQFIGESFLNWADEYFGISDDVDVNTINLAQEGKNLNHDIPRSELYNDFLEKNKTQTKYMTPQGFKKKILAWCTYRKLHFNPHKFSKIDNKPGAEDKRGSIEYFTIANEKF
jgi:DNA primase